MSSDLAGALKLFSVASEYVCSAGLTAEVEWHRRAELESFTESDLLREAAWVILCSGFRESVVQERFDHISLCFCDWESAAEIVAAGRACRLAALAVFRNESKLDAILGVATRVVSAGFLSIKRAIIQDPIPQLQQFGFVGPVTAHHLAKNLGLDIAKPDRHLVRISDRFGFESATHLCRSIGEASGEATRIVDLVLWRYLADNPTSLAANRDASLAA